MPAGPLPLVALDETALGEFTADTAALEREALTRRDARTLEDLIRREARTLEAQLWDEVLIHREARTLEAQFWAEVLIRREAQTLEPQHWEEALIHREAQTLEAQLWAEVARGPSASFASSGDRVSRAKRPHSDEDRGSDVCSEFDPAALGVRPPTRSARNEFSDRQGHLRSGASHPEQQHQAARLRVSAAHSEASAGRERRHRQLAEERWEQEHAATAIQSRYRGKAARRDVNAMREEQYRRAEKRREQECAATAIQSRYRSKAARRDANAIREEQYRQQAEERWEQECAATAIQSRYRGKAARCDVNAMREDQCRRRAEERREQECAATAIQSTNRGKAARRDVNAMREEQYRRAEERWKQDWAAPPRPLRGDSRGGCAVRPQTLAGRVEQAWTEVLAVSRRNADAQAQAAQLERLAEIGEDRWRCRACDERVLSLRALLPALAQILRAVAGSGATAEVLAESAAALSAVAAARTCKGTAWNEQIRELADNLACGAPQGRPPQSAHAAAQQRWLVVAEEAAEDRSDANGYPDRPPPLVVARELQAVRSGW